MNDLSNREHYRGDGRPKRKYATRADAKNAIRMDSEGRLGNGIAPYRCPVCDFFHLGHYPANPLTRAANRERHRKAS